MKTEPTARTATFYGKIILLAGLSYAVIGFLWVAAVLSNTGPLLFSGPRFNALKSAAFLVLAVSAALAGRRARARWAIASSSTALLGLVVGLGLYRLGEMLLWPNQFLGCRTHVIPNVGPELACVSPYFPLYHFSALEQSVVCALVVTSVTGLAVLSGGIARHLRRSEFVSQSALLDK